LTGFFRFFIHHCCRIAG